VASWIRGNLLGLIAIFIALSGTAVATQVAGNDGATTAKAKAKKGPRGPAGPPGAQGAVGPQGVVGPSGATGPTGPAIGPASGDLTGNYPNPAIAPHAVTPDKLGVIPAVRALDAFQSGGTDHCGVGFTSVPNSAVTTLLWEHETFDTAGMHIADALCQNPNASRITAPMDGVYVVSAGVLWGQNATGTRYLGINVNGNGLAADERQANGGAGAGSTTQNVTAETVLHAGDFVTAEVNQTSGSSLVLAGDDDRTFFSAVWLGPAS